VPEYRQDLANSQSLLGSSLASQGKRPEASSAFRAAIQTQERLTAEQPKVPAYAIDLGTSYLGFGYFVRNGGQPAQALEWFAKAIAILDSTVRRHGPDVVLRQG
jgi:tetratricopeptide (TPR) repeat protein